MAPLRVLCAGLLALVTFAAFPVQADEAPAPAASTDPVGEAIAKIKAASTAAKISDLEDPRLYLIENRQRTLPRVLALLDENDVAIRLNGAIILAKMAQAGEKAEVTENLPTLIGGLQRCLKESVSGVNYWGFVGLMTDKTPPDARNDALKYAINVDRPRPFRLAAVPTLVEKKPKAAIPLIIVHLQNILKECKTQVQTIVVNELPAAPAAPAEAGRPGERPAPMDHTDMGGMDHMAAAPQPVGRGQLYLRDDLLNPTKMPEEQVKALIPIVEKLPAVKEVHLMGLTLEDLIKTYYPDQKTGFPFGFDSTVPWDLDKCVDQAVLWLQAHKADFEPAAAAPKPGPAPATPATPTKTPEPTPAPAKTVR